MPVPTLPDRRGSTQGILVFGDELPGEVYAWGFALPLHWVEGTDDSHRLPAGLRAVAEQVRATLGAGGWGLHLAPELGDVDLSRLRFECPSLWAPLTAGLQVAVVGGVPRPWVHASGAWRGGGVESVGDVEAKVEAVAALCDGLDEGNEPVLFVPRANEQAALGAVRDRFCIRAYPRGNPSVHESLRAHLAELESQPERLPDNLQQRLEYANRRHIVRAWNLRRQYYRRCLLDDLAEGIAAARESALTVSRLAISLSKQPELGLLVVKALSPAAVLVVHTRETVAYVEGFRAGLSDREIDIVDTSFSLGRARECLRFLRRWMSSEPDSERRAVDITGGTKPMTAALLVAARAVGAKVLYLTHEYEHDAPVYGTESIEALDWTSSSEDME